MMPKFIMMPKSPELVVSFIPTNDEEYRAQLCNLISLIAWFNNQQDKSLGKVEITFKTKGEHCFTHKLGDIIQKEIYSSFCYDYYDAGEQIEIQAQRKFIGMVIWYITNKLIARKKEKNSWIKKFLQK